MRRFLVAGNWKMHGSRELTAELISGVSRHVLDNARISEQKELAYDILVCPATPFLMHASTLADALPIQIGAQNVNANEQGAFTGEVSLGMLQEFGCGYVLLGHSERREVFGETDAQIAEKFASCIDGSHGVRPILCVGETLAARQAGNTESVVAAQLDAVLEVVGIEGFKQAVVAYEPVWAIGTGETASPQQAQQVHAFIRAKLNALNTQIAGNLQILYGGSVKPTNAEELFAQQDIDGGLIGGASLKVSSFAGICQAAQKLATQA